MSLENKPCISVIMSVYNIAALTIFPQAVDSILRQTLHDFELIICDDGSTDGTWEQLLQLERSDCRIRLLRNVENVGLAASLNRCLHFAHGTYIARQDADDISAPERLAKQLAFLEKHPSFAFVGSNVTLWDESGIWGRRRLPQTPTAEDFLFTMPYVHGALLFRREALERAGGYRVSRETRRAEDYDLLMRIYAQGERGGNLQEELYAYREDTQVRQRRKYRYRIDEALVRYHGFRNLHLLPRGLPFVVKPLLVGLIPGGILMQLRRGKMSRELRKRG